MTMTDRYGLPLSTASATAAARSQEGMDRPGGHRVIHR
jgi:hypothetical protein